MSENNPEPEAGSSSKRPQEEEVFELKDIIREEEEIMEEVAAVLGAGDDFNCSYNQGYLKRQALYSCLTCLPESKSDHTKSAGFCLACSYYCHEGHDLVELYTKRNFRCDCGNSRFGAFICNLQANKDTENALNKYNQNFSGLYCICAKPYPDPEDQTDDEMIQCIICEDWYHSRHLNAKVPKDFSEMICSSCLGKHEFLAHYAGFAITTVESAEKPAETVLVTEEPKEPKESAENEEKAPEEPKEEQSINVEKVEVVNNTETAETETAATVEVTEEAKEDNKMEVSTEEETPKVCTSEIKIVSIEEATTLQEEVAPKEEAAEIPCKKPAKLLETPVAIFMKDLNWREQLCKCGSCMEMYKEEKLEFLLDLEDTVEYYENKGKQRWTEIKVKAQQEEEKMLKSLPRVPALEMIAGINEFKEQLNTYLRSFAEQQKVLTVEDVHEFFSNLKENYHKKRKTEHNHYCH